MVEPEIVLHLTAQLPARKEQGSALLRRGQAMPTTRPISSLPRRASRPEHQDRGAGFWRRYSAGVSRLRDLTAAAQGQRRFDNNNHGTAMTAIIGDIAGGANIRALRVTDMDIAKSVPTNRTLRAQGHDPRLAFTLEAIPKPRRWHGEC
jgi:hypothetical protein